MIYNETKLKPELIQEVDLGAFTHKVDEGLPLRKAAYGLIETLLDHIPEKVEPNSLAENLIQGLSD
jgi:cullin-associated NEDD8-dissociated protein 1